MLEFFKRRKNKKESLNEVNNELEVVDILSLESEPTLSLETMESAKIEDNTEVQAKNTPKFIIKEDAKIMSIQCDHKNILPQAVLKIDKTLISNPNNVAVYINLSHLNSVETVEEASKEIIPIKNPCGGADIQGEVMVSRVILIAGVHYSVLLYDTATNGKVYDGDVEFLTAYTNVAVLPFGEKFEEIDPKKVKTNFKTKLTKLDDIPGVDFYLYTIDGEVNLQIIS